MITIQRYNASDSDSVDQLFLELQKHENQYDKLKSTKLQNAIKYKKELLETINDQHGEMLVAKDNDEVLGLVAWFLEEELEFDEPYGYISDIVVFEQQRGEGIGQQLLDEAITHIKATGVKRLHIGVLLSNSQTKEFYTKNGFVEYSVEMTKLL